MNLIAEIIGWIVIVIVGLVVFFSTSAFRFKDGIYKCIVLGFGPCVIDIGTQPKLYVNMKKAGYRIKKVGHFAIGFSHPFGNRKSRGKSRVSVHQVMPR